MFTKIKYYFSLVKFAHTLFSLPFALIGFFIGLSDNNYEFNFYKFFLIVLAVFFARNSAMAFNRLVDKDVDKLNNRTAEREIPSGKITARQASFFIIINITLFIIIAFLINPLCFYLSPVALLIILSYSYFKRFSWSCHFVLGLSLSIAPIGAYIAITNKFAFSPLMFSLLVLLWTSGFDIIYSLQDVDFDKKLSLKSIPVKFGIKKALNISGFLHFFAVIIIWLIYFSLINTGIFFLVGSILFTLMLIYQHVIISVNNLSKINLAFFTTNGIASVLYAFFIISDIYLLN